MAIGHATNTLCHRLLDSRTLLVLATLKIVQQADVLETSELGWLYNIGKEGQGYFYIVQTLYRQANTSYSCAARNGTLDSYLSTSL